jgi:spore coat protein H
MTSRSREAVVPLCACLLLGACAQAGRGVAEGGAGASNGPALTPSGAPDEASGGAGDNDVVSPSEGGGGPVSEPADGPPGAGGASVNPLPAQSSGNAGSSSTGGAGENVGGAANPTANGGTSNGGAVGQGATGGASAETEDILTRGEDVFDRDRLHVVAITVAAENLAALDERTDTRIPATIVFDGIELSNVGVRNKGQTSFQPTSGKPGFSVKFDEFVEDQKLDGLKKLLLNNTTQDPTWCNETLTYETYRRAGIPAPRVAFAVVTLNGEAKGIYSIGEAVNEQFLARHYGKDMNEGNLYEGPWDFSDSVDAADLKDEVEENRSRDDLRALQELVLSEPDEGFAERLEARLDLEQFLLGYAIDAVTVAWDGYAYDAWNFYLYDHPGDQRFLFLPTGANWPYFRDAADAAPTVDPRELVSLWGGGKDPASFLAGARVQDIPTLDARFEALVRDVTHDVFDVAALHADFDRIDRTLHSLETPDEATRRDVETFDAYKHMAYEFVERRKEYLVEQFPR